MVEGGKNVIFWAYLVSDMHLNYYYCIAGFYENKEKSVDFLHSHGVLLEQSPVPIAKHSVVIINNSYYGDADKVMFCLIQRKYATVSDCKGSSVDKIEIYLKSIK